MRRILLALFFLAPNLGWAGPYEDGLAAYMRSDYSAALGLFRPLAVAGNAEAQRYLGIMYLSGEGLPRDKEQAMVWFHKAADQGNTEAKYALGLGYANGQGVPKDDAQAVVWFRKAADQDNAKGQCGFGVMYANGRGVPKDEEQAVVWYRKAADQGLAEAQINLGEMYLSGKGVPKDDAQGVVWYRKAADQNNALAQYYIGGMYANGQGVPKDDAQAVVWFRKAADQGLDKAQIRLGEIYFNGKGVPKDDAQAVVWFRKAAVQGNAKAQTNLGWMYAKGRGLPKDYKEAAAWYRKAADQGLAEAQFELGQAYANGRGVPKDEEQAVVWYRKAADQGLDKAQIGLGEMYANGRGVPKNDEQAGAWYRKAADQGDVKVPAPAEGFSLIPAGAFQMGDSFGEGRAPRPERRASERPLRQVTVSAFYIAQWETTKAEWDEVRTWGLSRGYTDLAVGEATTGNHPVQTVSWWDAIKWCNARSEKDGLSPVYSVNGAVMRTGTTEPTAKWEAKGYRLPTEAEWEKAARGGLNGKRFPWGDTISRSQANFFTDFAPYYHYDISPTLGNDYKKTLPVGSFAVNGYGLHDMAGNVWEWCWDWYGNYASGAHSDPKGPTSGLGRVFRGGAWNRNAFYSRVAFRYGFDPSERSDYNGFRLARGL